MQIVTAFIIFSLLLLHSIPGFGQEASLTLIYSSNTLGEVESGCCPETGNAGGLARRAHTIKAVSKEAKNRLMIDGGDAFSIGPTGNENEKKKARTRAEFILKIYGKMGYDAINIGDTDLILGVDYLKTLSKKSKIPFLSANIQQKKPDQPAFEPYRINRVNGLKIGIIGLLTPYLPPYLHKEMTGYFVEDPIKIALKMTNGPLSHCDHIIALAHLNMMEIEDLAQKAPRVSDTGGVNTYENHLILLHPGIESDPENEKLISSSRDLLKRHLP